VTTPATVVNGLNLRATNVTAHTIVFAPNPKVVAWTTGQATVTLAVAGQKADRPASRPPRSTARSRSKTGPPRSASLILGLGIKPSSIALNTQPNGWTNLQASLVGKTMLIGGSQGVRLGRRPEHLGAVVRGAAGAVGYSGSDLAYITSFNLQLAVRGAAGAERSARSTGRPTCSPA